MRKKMCGKLSLLLALALLLSGCGGNTKNPSDASESASVSETGSGSGTQSESGSENASASEEDTSSASRPQTESPGSIKGKFPTLYADAPDLDIIRIGENYYMTSTTMNLCPGVPVMKSTDLVHWEIVNYVYDTFEDDDITNLENNQDMYGRGSWAASLKYDEASKLYYVGFCSNNHGFYIYTTDDIENGKWKKHSIRESFHDPALFIEDGKLYVISASGDNCRMQQLTLNDEKGTVSKTGVNINLFKKGSKWGLWEGAHAYKFGDYYYVFVIASPNDRWMRTQLCYRSKKLSGGSWEEKVVYQAGLSTNGAGLAQGGIIQTQYGDWYGFAFQDTGSVGRIPSIVDVKWEKDWPMFGVYGSGDKFITNGHTYTMEIRLPDSGKENFFAGSDEFDYKDNAELGKVWQWNHNPKNDYWSVTANPGFLRLTTDKTVQNIWYAHNSLTQRTVGPSCTSEVKLYTDSMKPGDYAGLSAVADHYGMIGIQCDDDDNRYIFQANAEFKQTFSKPNEVVSEKLGKDQPVWLRITYDFKKGETATFYYSLDGEEWKTLGSPYQMGFSTSTTFMGARSWLFNYATKTAGGSVDFDYYKITQ